VPSIENNNHERETTMKPSLLVILSMDVFFDKRKNDTDIIIDINAEQRKG